MSVDDEERSGRTSTRTTAENVAKVQQAILEDRRWTILYVYNIVGLSYETCQGILLDEVNMLHITVCTKLKERAEDEPNFVSNITTGEASWVFGYDAETRQQSSQRKTPTSPRLKKVRQIGSNVKSMLIVRE